MKPLAGAIVIFAAAVLFAGGAIADALAEAAKSKDSPGGVLAMLFGVGVGLLGVVILGLGWTDETKRRAGRDSSEGAVPR